MKHILVLCFAAMLATQTWGQTSFTDDVLTYTVIEGTTNVSVDKGSTAPTGAIEIPPTVEIDGTPYTVTNIGNYAFYNCSGLTSVSIPNSVTSIGNYVFKNCFNLASITIGNSVTSIGEGSFIQCSKLANISVENGNTNYSSDGGVLYNYNKTTLICYPAGKTESSYTIPNSVTNIGSYAFEGCFCLTLVTIPNSVISIGSGAFEGCFCLTSVTIPNSVTSIGSDAFEGCQYQIFTKYGNCLYLGNDENPYLIFIKPESTGITSCDINSNCRIIADIAFEYCRSLTLISIPNSVTSIGQFAFAYCKGLTSVSIPESVISIGDHAFSGCSSLASVTIPNSITSIGSGAFYSCSSLTSITIPNSVISIGDHAFSDCSGLTSVTIPNSVTSIVESAFSYCSDLTSVTIPNSVTSIGPSAFAGCNSLTTVTIPNSVTSIGHSAFAGCKSLTSVTIPESVTNIGGEAFYCSNLITVAIPNSVTSIGGNAFQNCCLTNINVKNGNTNYSSEDGVLFNYNKTRLICYPAGKTESSYNIPNSVKIIGDYAFAGCSHLTAIAYDGTSEPYIEGIAFNSTITVCVPENYNSDFFGEFEVFFKGHNKITDQAVPPTCTETGLTEGVHCANCGRVFVVQEEIPATGHTAAEAVAENYAAPTCTAAGAVDSVVYCTTCKSELNRKTVEIAATGHNEVADVAVAATCTAAGKIEGKHCSACNEILVAQTDIPALGHDFAKYTYNNDATTEADGTETAACEHGCGTTDTRTAAGTKIATTPEKGTAVTETAASNVNIYAQGRTIVVENATEGISVYNAMGALVCRDAMNRVRTEINVRTAGIYIVRVGNTVKRVMVNE